MMGKFSCGPRPRRCSRLILLAGLYTLLDRWRYLAQLSNRLMRMRVLAQFITVLIILAVLYFSAPLTSKSARPVSKTLEPTPFSMFHTAGISGKTQDYAHERPAPPQKRCTTRYGTATSSIEAGGRSECHLYRPPSGSRGGPAPQAVRGLGAKPAAKRAGRELALAGRGPQCGRPPDRSKGISDPDSRQKRRHAGKTMRAEFPAIEFFGMNDIRQGHRSHHRFPSRDGTPCPVSPSSCGDSHTRDALAPSDRWPSASAPVGGRACAGDPDSLHHTRSKNMRITGRGQASDRGPPRKDIIPRHPSQRSERRGGTGYVIEYAGDTISRACRWKAA